MTRLVAQQRVAVAPCTGTLRLSAPQMAIVGPDARPSAPGNNSPGVTLLTLDAWHLEQAAANERHAASLELSATMAVNKGEEGRCRRRAVSLRKQAEFHRGAHYVLVPALIHQRGAGQ